MPLRKAFPTDLLFPGPTLPAPQNFNPGTLLWEVRYAQANIFVKSGSILEVLPGSGQRLLFTRQLATEVITRAPADDAYFFDFELQRLVLQLRSTISPRLALQLEMPFVRYTGGLMDGLIEKFHSLIGIGDDERPDFRRNTAQAFLYLDGHAWFRDGLDIGRFGPGDVALQAEYLLSHFTSATARSRLMLRAAVELPTGSFSVLRGNGKLDFAAGIGFLTNFGRNGFYAALDAVLPGGWKAFPHFKPAVFSILQVGYERLLGKNLSLLLQANSNSNVFRGRTHTGLAGLSHEISLGVKRDFGRIGWGFLAITENYAYFRNSPDLGFSIGFEKGR